MSAVLSRLVRLYPFGWVRHIPREGGAPYMDRYTLRKQNDSGANPWRVYLNHFRAPDSDGHHNHPSKWGLSLVLLGSYTEEILVPPKGRCMGNSPLCIPACLGRLRTRRVHWINWIPSDKYHRIVELHPTTNSIALWLARRWPTWFGGLTRGVWTLFTVGGLTERGWGFWEPGRGYVPHEVKEAERKLTPKQDI